MTRISFSSSTLGNIDGYAIADACGFNGDACARSVARRIGLTVITVRQECMRADGSAIIYEVQLGKRRRPGEYSVSGRGQLVVESAR